MEEGFVIKVCDAIMGSGKSSAAITYMNENYDKKFIYVTPYLTETKRICESCPRLGFIEPKEGIKHIHSYELIRKGKNISMSHQLLRDIPIELLDIIKEKEYTLIIDECLDVFGAVDESNDDIDNLIKLSNLQIEGDLSEEEFIPSKKIERPLSRYKKFYQRLETNDLVRIVDNEGKISYQWLLTLNFLMSFKDVFILTYLFEGSLMCSNLQLNGIPYIKIGVSKSGDSLYRFGNYNEHIPNYVNDIKFKIHIVDDEKLNAIGNDRNALSINWLNTKPPEIIDQVRKNLENFFQHKVKCKQSERMWGGFSGKKEGDKKIGDIRKKLSGRGYARSFVVFNKKATNEYRHKKVLAYTAKVYMNTGQKRVLKEQGIEPKEQMYALSTLIQWVWRSAIRDGEEITIYIPSYRMRILFERWLDIISTGGDIEDVEKRIPRIYGYK